MGHWKMLPGKVYADCSQPVSQGVVFAASEAEWRAHDTLNCKEIIGMAPNLLLARQEALL